MLTEFGYAPAGEAKQPVEQAIQDEERVTFYRGALESLAEARAAGVVIKGIFPWSKSILEASSSHQLSMTTLSGRKDTRFGSAAFTSM